MPDCLCLQGLCCPQRLLLPCKPRAARHAMLCACRYNSVLMIHTIMLALTVVLALVYGWLWVRPHCARVAREGGWVAGLLSHVPREMDVLAHARHVLRMHGHHDQRRTANK